MTLLTPAHIESIGTELWAYIEKRKDGKWDCIDKWEFIEEDRIDTVAKPIDIDDSIYLHGLLGGLDTDNGWPVIAPPRGLPKGCSLPVYLELDNTYFARSHVSLRELVDFDWDEAVPLINDKLQTYRQTVYPTLAPTLERMVALSELPDQSDVRLVYGFY